MKNEQLQAFIAVVETGTFRAAADTLYKTQSTISLAIQNLEQEFEFRLFSRETYRPTLTPEGKAFYKEAKALLVQVQNLTTLGHELAQPNAPKLTVSLSARCAIPPILKAIYHFQTENTDIDLIINSDHMSGLIERLDGGDSDVAIGTQHGLGDQYEFVQITQIPMISVASPRLFDTPSQGLLTHAQMRRHPQVLIEDRGAKPFEHINVIQGGKKFFVADYTLQKNLVMEALGWARVPKYMVDQEMTSGNLLPLNIEHFNNQSDEPVYLIRSKSHPTNNITEDFWNALLANLKNSE
ncbi:LysR family transcriptional regulator [Marinomonas mediterranea]|uniref:LysR family transcriptional regulator n=1 Tax=Marinomonas mediterranea TaxID=119864 RepID=UPI00234A7FD8|nr:LysR family transcriptional regulator [Marinomonas mediterranea]WCN07534.1 LysR family transcriptional regulator [Marinomonas mediterranea]